MTGVFCLFFSRLPWTVTAVEPMPIALHKETQVNILIIKKCLVLNILCSTSAFAISKCSYWHGYTFVFYIYKPEEDKYHPE